MTVEGLAGGSCPFNCVYCTVAHPPPTTRRRRVADAHAVGALLDVAREKAGALDHLVIGGGGDPLLWTGIGDFLRRVHTRYAVPLAVLTPGPLLSRGAIRDAMEPVDVVMVKLDAGLHRLMQAVNRPHRGVRFDRLVESLGRFAAAFDGALWAQTRPIPGVNDGIGEMTRLATALRGISPAKVIVAGLVPGGWGTRSEKQRISLGEIQVLEIPDGTASSGSAVMGADGSAQKISFQGCWRI